MRLLCLDLATRIGWACGSLDGFPVAHGVRDLPETGLNIGRFLFAFRKWLTTAIEEMAPTAILYESPILPKSTTIMTLRKLYCLGGETELIALDYELPCEETSLGSIRKHFIGASKAPKFIPKADRRGWLKRRTIEKCRARGFNVADDNDADALALLSYGLSLKQSDFILTNGVAHGQSAATGA